MICESGKRRNGDIIGHQWEANRGAPSGHIPNSLKVYCSMSRQCWLTLLGLSAPTYEKMMGGEILVTPETCRKMGPFTICFWNHFYSTQFLLGGLSRAVVDLGQGAQDSCAGGHASIGPAPALVFFYLVFFLHRGLPHENCATLCCAKRSSTPVHDDPHNLKMTKVESSLSFFYFDILLFCTFLSSSLSSSWIYFSFDEYLKFSFKRNPKINPWIRTVVFLYLFLLVG